MVYVLAQLLGSLVCAALVLPLYGFGQFGSLFDTRIFSFLGLSVPPHLCAQARRCTLSQPALAPYANRAMTARRNACMARTTSPQSHIEAMKRPVWQSQR